MTEPPSSFISYFRFGNMCVSVFVHLRTGKYWFKLKLHWNVKETLSQSEGVVIAVMDLNHFKINNNYRGVFSLCETCATIIK